jgi:hypothetical protein
MICNAAYLRYCQRNPVEGKVMSVENLTPIQVRLLMLRLLLGYPAWLLLGYSIQVIPLGIA